MSMTPGDWQYDQYMVELQQEEETKERERLLLENQLLRSRLVGHWLEDTQDYDWDDDSLPWSLS